MPPSIQPPSRRFAVSSGMLGGIAAIVVGASAGCVLVMDADFDRYRAAAEASVEPDSGAAGAGGGDQDAGPDAEDASAEDADGGGGTGAGGAAGTAGTGGTGGTQDAGPSCSDGERNQGELNVDCGGPCPPCPVLLHHEENFDAYPAFGPDGSYTVAGTCATDPLVPGWRFTNNVDPLFNKASSFYAIILTDALGYVGLPCDDSLITPTLNAQGARQVTIDFDSSFLVADACTASLVILRDGAGETVWSKTNDGINQHVSVGPVLLENVQAIRFFFRYQGTFQYYWKVDNVVVEAI